jgi:hypothetical protein
MVTEKIKDGKKYFLCDECGFAYLSKEEAQKCEDWCREHHSCNMELTKNAVKLD